MHSSGVNTKLSDLQANPENPRNISDAQLSMLKKSLEKFGDLSGVVVNETSGNIISGHQRTKVLPPGAEIVIENTLESPSSCGTIATGYILIDGERFSYRRVRVDDTMEKAMNLAANQHGGEFDLSKVAQWVLELDQQNVDLDLLGFSNEELDRIMAPIHPVMAPTPEPDVSAPTTCPHCGMEIGKT
jgi:hypothetical protein